MSNIERFQELMAGASEEGRAQYQAAIDGMRNNQEMGAAAAQEHATTLEHEAKRRQEIAKALAHQRALVAVLRSMGGR